LAFKSSLKLVQDKVLLKKATKVSLVVGSVLMVINQYDALFGHGQLKVIPAVLTYCVPFVVFIAGKLSGGSTCANKDCPRKAH